MSYTDPTFAGDAEHPIRCTGDVVVGDDVAFERATFSGSFRNAKFEGFERIVAHVVADSYGADRQQHTFTLALRDGSRLKIKGRNLYRNGTWRAVWTDESQRHAAAAEKHARGDAARAERDARRMDAF